MKGRFVPFVFISTFLFVLFQGPFWSFIKRWEEGTPLPFLGGDSFLALGASEGIISSWSEGPLIALAVTLITLVVCLPASLVLGRKKNQALEIALFLPVFIPLFIPAFGLYEFFLHLSIFPPALQVALGQACFFYPYMLASLNLRVRSLGGIYEEQSYSLGVGPFRTFWKITLPGLRPAIIVGVFFVFTSSLNDYFLSFLMGEGKVLTIPVSIYPFFQNDQRSIGAAAASFLAIPTVLLFPFVYKFWRDQDA